MSDNLYPYLERWQQARSKGEDLSAEQLCVDSPELLPQLQVELVRLRQSHSQSLINDTLPSNGTIVPEISDEIEAPPSYDESLKGRMIGEYRLIEEMGRGGMGVVYRAWDDRMARVVALKVILPTASADPNARKRFLREARAQGQIEHDNVTPIYHSGDDNGTLYIAMPLLVGEPLKDILEREGRLPLPYALLYAWQIADGLAAAHAKKVLHRDIKPGNVWVEMTAAQEFRRIRILDFGLARPSAAIDPHKTINRELLGTPAYMSPEQAGSGELDHRSDLFSFGVLLYEMVTGVQPFDDDNVLTALMNVTTVTPPTAKMLCSDLPESLSQLIQQLLEKRAEDRPSSAAEVAATIHELVVSEAVAIPAAIGSRIALPSLPSLRSSSGGPPSKVPTPAKLGNDWDQRPNLGAWDVPPEPGEKYDSGARQSSRRKGLFLVAIGTALCLGLGILILAASLGWFPDTGTQAVLESKKKVPPIPVVDDPDPVKVVVDPIASSKMMTVVLNGLPENAEVKFPDDSDVRTLFDKGYEYTTLRHPVRVQISAKGYESHELTIDPPSMASEDTARVKVTLRPTDAFTNSAGIRMRLIAPGTFTMGVDITDEDNNPTRAVTITQPFYFGQEEVTNAQFRQFVIDQNYETEAERGQATAQGYKYDPETPNDLYSSDAKYNWQNTGYPMTNDRPVVNVTWNDAMLFCEWLSKKEGRVYRLPTEAEWEFAARGNSPTGLPFPVAEVETYANIYRERMVFGMFDFSPLIEPTFFSTPVGKYPANSNGLFDCYGNVREWCLDWYSDPEEVLKLTKNDPVQEYPLRTHIIEKFPEGLKVARGGSFVMKQAALLQHRIPQERTQPYPFTGFRVLMELPKTK